MRTPRHTLDPYAVSPVLEIGRAEVEHRFLLDAAGSADFAARIAGQLQEEIHDPRRPITHVLTTYFDTEDRTLFGGGVDHRSRVRVRQYASATTPDALPVAGDLSALEIKEVTSEARRKARIVGTPADIARLVEQDGWLTDSQTSALRSLMPLFRAASAIATGMLGPTLTTAFRRRAFVGPEVRVTIDEGVVFAAPSALIQSGEVVALAGIYSRLPYHVVEVKLTGPAPDWLSQAIAGYPLADRFSKYREGLLAANRIEVLAAAARTPTPRAPSTTFVSFDHEPSRVYAAPFDRPTRA